MVRTGEVCRGSCQGDKRAIPDPSGEPNVRFGDLVQEVK